MNFEDLRRLCDEHGLLVVGATEPDGALPGVIVDVRDHTDTLGGLPPSVEVTPCGQALALIQAKARVHAALPEAHPRPPAKPAAPGRERRGHSEP
jgi:hypothetical protein